MLQDGQLYKVLRSITFGADEWFRSGRGPITKQTISIQRGQTKILWQNDDRWPNYSTPVAIEFEGDEAAIIFPVYTWGPCNKYGHPQDGLVTFKYNDKKWHQSSVSQLAPSIKVNLLQGSILRYHPEYTNKLITIAVKKNLEISYRSKLKQGSSLTDAAAYYSSMGTDSCSHMRPRRDPRTETLRQSIADAERNAKAITSVLTEAASSAVQISSDDFANAMGVWTGNGYLSNKCKGIVARVNLAHRYDNNGGQHLMGSEIILSNGTLLPFRTDDTQSLTPHVSLEKIECDNNTLYVFKRQRGDGLMVHRFEQTGEMIDALRVALPVATRLTDQERPPYIWGITRLNEGLAVMLADYTYTQAANLGGIIRQRYTYLVKTPN